MTLRHADGGAVRTSCGQPAGLSPRGARLGIRLACVGLASLTVANCSPQNLSGGSSYDPKYGVHASRRVYREGEPIPKGGGREMVGRPYVVAGRTYVPRENPSYAREGLASWYGSAFHGRFTANGEIFDRHAIAAAHTTMPLPSYARVTNLENGRSIIVRVNDRGPYHGNRIIDVSERTAEALEFRGKGTARVRVEYVRRASPHGSDDRILLASLRTDGLPAALPGSSRTLLASAETPPPASAPALAFRSREVAPRASAAVATQTVEAAAASVPVTAPLPPQRPLGLRAAPSTTPMPLSGATAAMRRSVGPDTVLSYAALRPSSAGQETAPAGPRATKNIAPPDLHR